MSIELKYYFTATEATHELVLVRHWVCGAAETDKTVSLNEDYFICCVVTLRHNLPVGCCCLYDNPHISYQTKNTLLIGNFECVHEYEVFVQIMNGVAAKALSLEKEYLIGPMDGSTWDNYRFTLTPYENLFFTEQHHPGWYPHFFERYGFSEIASYQSSKGMPKMLDTAHHNQIRQDFLANGIVFRNIDLFKYEQELKKIHALSMEAFEDAFLFSPISFGRFYEKYVSIVSLINPAYTLLAENKQGELLGFMFCIPDRYNEQNLIIKTVACRKDIRGNGLVTWMTNEVVRIANNNNVSHVVHAFMHVSNASVKLSTQFGGQIFRKYALYGKSI